MSPFDHSRKRAVGVSPRRLFTCLMLGSTLLFCGGATAAEIVYNFSADDGTYRFEVAYTFNDAAGFSDNGARLNYNTTEFNGEHVIVDISYEIRNSGDNSLVAAYDYGDPPVVAQSYAQFFYANQAMALSTRRVSPSNGQAYILVQFPSTETGIVSTNPPASFSTTPVWINFYYTDGATGLTISRRVTTNLSASLGDCDHSELEAQIAALEIEVQDLVGELAAANASLTEATDLLESCNAEVINLEAANAALVAQRDALIVEVAALESAVGALESQVDAANAEVASLQASLASTEADLDAANDSVVALTSDLAAADATIADQADVITTQSALIVALQEESESLLAEISEVGAARASIEASLSSASRRDVVLEGSSEAEKIQSLATAIDGLSKGQKKALAAEIMGKPKGKSDKSKKSDKSGKSGKKYKK